MTAPATDAVHDPTRTVLSTERRDRKHAEGYARTTRDQFVPVPVVAPMVRTVVRTILLNLETRRQHRADRDREPFGNTSFSPPLSLGDTGGT
jgi:hypothetical protein